MAGNRVQQESGIVSFFSFQDIIVCVAGIMILLVLLLILDIISRPVVENLEAAASRAQATQETEALKKRLEEINKRIDRNKLMLAQSPDMTDEEITRRIDEAEKQLDDTKGRMDNLAGQRNDVSKSMDKIPAIVQHHEEQQKALDERSVEVGAASDQYKTMETGRQEQGEHLKDTTKKVEDSKSRLGTLKEGKNVYFRKEVNEDKTPILVEVSKDKIQAKSLDAKDIATFDAADESARVSKFLEWAKGRNKDTEYFVVLIKPDTITTGSDIIRGLKLTGFEMGYDALDKGQSAMMPEDE